jgi:putative hydrolase of the HAD superfamily
MAENGQAELSNLKAVIFDYGDVLCLPPTGEEIEASARIMGISRDLYRALWSRNRDMYDRGDMSPETYWRTLAEDAGTSLDAAQVEELHHRDMAMWSRPNPGMLAWLQDLAAAGMKTAILSNMHAGMIQHARQNFRWLDWLNWKTFSAEVGSIKPEPAIYEHCRRGLGVAATDSLLIDDREVNILAARSMGFHGIQYKSMAQLRSELQTAGFSILPPDVAARSVPSA